jgi:prophage regulatory protein
MKKFKNFTMNAKVTAIPQPQRLVRIITMTELLDCSRSTLYRWVEKGLFPAPKMHNGRTLGWTLSQYEGWLAEK